MKNHVEIWLVTFRVKLYHIYIFSHYSPKIKIGLYDSLLKEKTLTLHNVTILINSVFDNDKNHYYYKILFEKCSYQLAKKQSQYFCSIKMVRLEKKGIAKEKFYAAKKPKKNWNVNVDNIVISKLIETETW